MTEETGGSLRKLEQTEEAEGQMRPDDTGGQVPGIGFGLRCQVESSASKYA